MVDPTGVLGTGVTTLGNNASTYANYSNFIGPVDQGPRPVSPTGSFNYVYTNQWAATKGTTLPPSYVQDLNPAATNLFYQHNRIHDELYGFGFTESAGNFQVDNAGGGGQGGDPILGLVHAGAASGGAPTYTGRDNAYMLTLDDGIPPWSGMFLWEPIDDAFEGPYADGNFDASVVEHEYVHGLSNRYVGGGSALSSQQSGSMGEGWSDWYALNHLYTAGLATTAVVGQHVTGNTERGIRNWSYDKNPTTFGDIGYDVTGPEVHADGEIWTATLWDLRKALVAKYGAAKGADVAARLVTDGMPLTAPDPSFLDARDGILAADVDRNHGDNTDLIWTVFAKRGAGASAISHTGDDTDPTPAFDNASASRNGLLSLKIVNASTGTTVTGAKVIIGRFEARVTPVARTSSTGGAAARMVAGSYPVSIQAPGFGLQTFESVPVTAGATTSRTLRLAPNLASLSSGATIVSAVQPGHRAAGRLRLRRHRCQRVAHGGRSHHVQRRSRPAGHDQARQAIHHRPGPGQRLPRSRRWQVQHDQGLHGPGQRRRRAVEDGQDRSLRLPDAASHGSRPELPHVHPGHTGQGELPAVLRRLGSGQHVQGRTGC